MSEETRVRVPEWIEKGVNCSFEQEGERKIGKILKVDPENMNVTVKSGKVSVVLTIGEIQQTKEATQDDQSQYKDIPKIDASNFKKQWENKYPKLVFATKRPRWDVIEYLLKQPSVDIKIPAGPKGSAKVETIIINQQYFHVPRGKSIQGPKQIRDMLEESGHMDGQEMLMHTHDVRAQRGFSTIANFEGAGE